MDFLYRNLNHCILNTRNYIWLILFLIAAGLYAVDLWHPVDRLLWREADVASIARNFDRDGMNILEPRIDWRGDGPGFAEMEFPAYPWMIAVMYKIFGQYDIIGRFLSYLFSLLSLLVFFKMARSWLEPPASYIAALFFVFSPLIVQISNNVRPEPFMLLLDFLAIYFFVLWKDSNSWKHLIIASIATSLAILAKISNLYIGILFLFILLQKKGLRSFSDYRIYVFGFIALLPPILWYVHAKGYWLDYGNSLGLSNEYHWIGWDFFTDIYSIKGLFFNELFFVFMPVGIVVVLFGLFSKQFKNSQIRQYAFFWLVSVYIYYVLTIRTTADLWSIYYHSVSVAPIALLFGMGINRILKIENEKVLYGLLYSTVAVVLILTVVTSLWYIRPPYMGENMQLLVFAICLAFIGLIFLIRIWDIAKLRFLKNKLPLLLASFLVFTTLAYQAYKISEIYKLAKPAIYYTECVDNLRTIIPDNSLILVSGGKCFDRTGYPLAHNSPYFFYWLDKKGFNICVEDQSIKKIEEFSIRGAQYFIAEEGQLEGKDGFEKEMRMQYPVLYEGPGLVLFDIR
ncbi:MAG: glycosyltransferase family 39 protein [Bacteroidales bacterium]|nr:glycosyltransferase family 39 protein [Bacteroidales bacterium]MCF8455160.1 glycosyltransferase family 39 protein [Bacteroidales bacterium]